MLTEIQKKTRDQVVEKISNNTYKQTKNPCLCGAQNDIVLAFKDRFDIPIKTVLCKGCGLVRSDPYYDNKTLASFYQKEYRLLYTGSEQASESFFNEQKSFGLYIYEYLVENFFHSEINDKKIFEIGCGAGGILQTFKEHGNNVYGCDYGEEYVNFGKGKGLNLVAGGSQELSTFGKADIIILNHVLEHMKDLKKELREITDLLSPSGIVYIALPGIYSIHDTYRGRFIDGYLQNAHVWYFTLRTLTETLGRFGFRLNIGNEIIMSIFSKDDGATMVEKENPKKVYNYLRKIRILKWYYVLKKFSLRHFLIETFRHSELLYKSIRWIYRKIKNK